MSEQISLISLRFNDLWKFAESLISRTSHLIQELSLQIWKYPPLCQQIDVYTREETGAWHAFLTTNDDQMRQSESTPRRELLKVNPETEAYRYKNLHNTYFPVTLDEQGKVISENVSGVYLGCRNLEMVKPLLNKGIESMAQALQLTAGVHKMGISILQHHNFVKEKGMKWHEDLSSYTLVVLLDDETQWNGGDFLFRVKGVINQFFSMNFKPQLGKGILFTNSGTQHKVEPFSAKRNSATRTIFTIHYKKGEIQ